jgi:CRP-like cAMP-binding protein
MRTEDNALARKLSAFEPLGSKEMSMLRELQKNRVIISSGSEVVYEGQHRHSAYILQRGWACSYKRLRDGGRQIIDIHVPGDFLGVRSLLLRKSDHSFVTLTEVEVAKIAMDLMADVFRETPRLALGLLWAASRDEALVVEHLVSIGRRGALERTAHFLLELGARLKLVGIGTGDRYPCPVSQSILADTLGMTPIHLNRVLRQLREAQLVIFREGAVMIPNIERAGELTGFDRGYLDHGKQ